MTFSQQILGFQHLIQKKQYFDLVFSYKQKAALETGTLLLFYFNNMVSNWFTVGV
jgi:hypothetical protein